MQATGIVFDCVNTRNRWAMRNLHPPPISVILRGMFGAGKTTFAEAIERITAAHGLRVRRCSTDGSFVNSTGEYVFNPALLPQAHANCYRSFLDGLAQSDVVIVDNTNITTEEWLRYKDANEQYILVTFSCDSEEEAHVQRTRSSHAVPVGVVQRRFPLFQSANLPLRQEFEQNMTDSKQVWVEPRFE